MKLHHVIAIALSASLFLACTKKERLRVTVCEEAGPIAATLTIQSTTRVKRGLKSEIVVQEKLTACKQDIQFRASFARSDDWELVLEMGDKRMVKRISGEEFRDLFRSHAHLLGTVVIPVSFND